MAFQKVLLKGEPLPSGMEKRLLPVLDVGRWDRIHLHVSGGSHAIGGLHVRILFGTPVEERILLADHTVWLEGAPIESDFSHSVSPSYNRTGFIMTVPVVAPMLYDVILRNHGAGDLPEVFVTLLAQEI